MSDSHDALILVSFGGPEHPEEVLPFIEGVVAGKNVPRQRLLQVTEHYHRFDGISPANAENRGLLAALLAHLNLHGPRLPVYWGNRHWHPFLAETVAQMAQDGVRRALALVTSAFGSYSSCRQYLEAIEQARLEVGSDAPEIDKLRLFHNHPGFIAAMVDRAGEAFARIELGRRASATLLFTAHAIPQAMADHAPYESQLAEACRLVAERVGHPQWQLVYQSRSGPPQQPWLGPALADQLDRIARAGGSRDVVLVPIGFLSENMEVVYDLDIEAADQADALGLNLLRAPVVGTHPELLAMIADLIAERLNVSHPRRVLGSLGPSPDVCSSECCRSC